MASWLVHFRVADGIMDSIKNVDMEKFIVGNIGPDCGELCEDGKSLKPLKYITIALNSKFFCCEVKRVDIRGDYNAKNQKIVVSSIKQRIFKRYNLHNILKGARNPKFVDIAPM